MGISDGSPCRHFLLISTGDFPVVGRFPRGWVRCWKTPFAVLRLGQQMSYRPILPACFSVHSQSNMNVLAVHPQTEQRSSPLHVLSPPSLPFGQTGRVR